MKTIKINHEGKTYQLRKDEFGDYDILDVTGKKIATSIHADYIDYTLDLIDLGYWCDTCKGEGLITNDDDGTVVVCEFCEN